MEAAGITEALFPGLAGSFPSYFDFEWNIIYNSLQVVGLLCSWVFLAILPILPQRTRELFELVLSIYVFHLEFQSACQLVEFC